MREDLRSLSNYLANKFIEQGMNEGIAHFLNMLINIIIVFLLWYLIHFITKRILLTAFQKFTNKTKTTFDDFLVKSNFPKFVSNILPLLLLIVAVPLIFEEYPQLLSIFGTLVDIYIVILTVLICRSLLRTTTNYLKQHERFRDKPVESYTQVLMIFIWSLGFMVIFSEITGKSVVGFLVTLGAASAVILLIFKDTILGFVASIQVSVNDIVRIGDWITFSKYGADGFVTEINLATVRVQNWDKTYTTIPTYSLISDSFHNWRGMQESPGRRVKRSLLIKQSTVRFVEKDDLERFSKYRLIKDYILERQKIIEEYNLNNKIDIQVPINGRRQTNLGIFRKYAENYLQQHPMVNQDMWVIVRHQDPTIHGIPLELYFFSSNKQWVFYEGIAADIFEHLIAAVPYFDLQLFESPAGDDIIKAVQTMSRETK